MRRDRLITAWFGIALIVCFTQIMQPALAHGRTDLRWSRVEKSVAAFFKSVAGHPADFGTMYMNATMVP
ncbi:MAG TPA: hypothetical protein VGD08_27485 [Stellaceae bacterium]|jgi:hypothetical protein